YLAQSDPGGKRRLLAYGLKAGGTVAGRRVLHDFGKDRGIDGMCIDVKGNIYGAAGQGKTGGVYVFDVGGKRLAFRPVRETPTDCVFGGRAVSLAVETARCCM